MIVELLFPFLIRPPRHCPRILAEAERIGLVSCRETRRDFDTVSLAVQGDRNFDM
jgi:hypothetical protein